MIALTLSYFNLKTGPSILISTPESFSEQILDEIPRILDIYDIGFSVQIFESYKSANLQFCIENERTRGGEENLLLSIITDIKYYLNINIAKEILNEIECEIRELKDAYMAFHPEYDNKQEKTVIKIKKIINKYYNSIQSTIRALERAEIRYQSLFKSARDAIFLINKLSSEIIDVNQEGIYLMQNKRKDLIGKEFDEVFKVESKESLFSQIISHNDNEQLDLISTVLISQSGQKIGVEINSSIVNIGSEIIIQCIVRNISKRLEAEEKLKISEEKYRLTIENANDLIKVLNSKFEYEELNENIHKRVLGFSKEELLYKSPIAHVHPEDRKQSSLLLSKILRKGKGSFQARFKHKNGTTKWLEISAKNFVDSAGNKKVITVGRDITDRKLAEQKLIESEEKYRLITDNAYDLISLLDKNLNHIFINESRYKEKLGYTNEDLIGKSVLEYIHPDDIQRTIENRDRAVKTGKSEGNLIRIKKKDGTWLWLETRSRIFSGEDQELKAVIISRDVTEHITSNQIQKDSQNKLNRFQ